MNDLFSATDHWSQVSKRYSRAASIHESSARLLRASGRDAAAEQVERYAAAARDRITYSTVRAQMYALARRLGDASQLGELLEEALDGAIMLLGADRGSIQLADRNGKALRIVCQRGFGRAFVEHFAVVDDDLAACGRAARAMTQAVIPDVNADPAFADHRAIAAVSGFRAVQSTPLIDSTGRLRGVLSTHFVRPHRPRPHELRMAETYGRLVADAIAAKIDAPAA